jgi:hypothetical protein
MKKTTLAILLWCPLSLLSCSKGADVDAFIADRKTVIGEVSKQMQAGDVDAAQAIFNVKKDHLKSSCQTVKNSVTDKMSWAESQLSDMDIFTKAMNSDKVGKDIPTLTKSMALLNEIGDICD